MLFCNQVCVDYLQVSVLGREVDFNPVYPIEQMIKDVKLTVIIPDKLRLSNKTSNYLIDDTIYSLSNKLVFPCQRVICSDVYN